jgi:hypothetical protein
MDASDINLYRGTPRQVKYWALRCLQAGLIPMVQGSPGLGKSSMIRGTAKEMNLKLIDDRIATNGPEHYTGLPDVSGDKAVYKPFDVFPLEGDPLPKDENGNDMEGWLFFLDEFNSGLPTTMVGAYKFLMEREIAQRKIHPKVWICAAGNRDEDRAITQQLGTAIQRRVVWLEMYLDGTQTDQFDAFMQDVALPQNWNSQVISFLHFKKAYLNNFDPSHQEKTFACPATWEMASKLANLAPVEVEDGPLYCGTLGAGVGTEFVNYCQLSKNIPTIKQVLDNPAYCNIPQDMGEQFYLVSTLVEATNASNLQDFGDYVERLGLEFRILYWRSIQMRQPALRREPAFTRAQVTLARYLFGA